MRVNAIVRGACAGLLIGASLLLSGCSESRETRAAKACISGMEARIEPGRPYAADVAAIAAAAKAEGDIYNIESEATLDAAQANESKQKFTCRVQFDPAKPDAEPSVILFQFNF